MGYYTHYTLKFNSNESIEEHIGNHWISKYFDQSVDGSYRSDAIKWYEHEDDMRVLSGQFPGVLFTLEGEGEEGGDLWIKYFLNGKMQSSPAKITYEPFDASKLK